MTDNVKKFVPYPELYKLHEDINQLINETEGLSLAGVVGVLEMVKLSLLEPCTGESDGL